MTDLEKAIEDLRRFSESAASSVSDSSDAELDRIGGEFNQELVSRTPLLTAANADAAGAMLSDLLNGLAGQLAQAISITTSAGLHLFEERSGIAASAEIKSALNNSARMAAAWAYDVPEGQAAYVRQLVGQAVLDPIPAGKVADMVRNKFGSETSGQIRSLVHTTFSNMDQAVILKVTEIHNYDLFLYAGPDDIIARPFCEHMVNRVFTKEAIAKCDNAQIPDVMLSRGGYNCRHRWMPTDKTTRFPIVNPYEIVKEVVSGPKAKVEKTIAYPVKREQ